MLNSAAMAPATELAALFGAAPIVTRRAAVEALGDDALAALIRDETLCAFKTVALGEEREFVLLVTKPDKSLEQLRAEETQAHAEMTLTEAQLRAAQIQRELAALSKPQRAATPPRAAVAPPSPKRPPQTLEELQKERMEQLHVYNDLKDLAQSLVMRISEAEQRPAREVYADYGISPTE